MIGIPLIAPPLQPPTPWDYKVHVCAGCGCDRAVPAGVSKPLQMGRCVSCEQVRLGVRLFVHEAERVTASWRKTEWVGLYAVCTGCGVMHFGVTGKYLLCNCQTPPARSDVQLASVIRRPE